MRKIDQDSGNQEYDRFKGREHLILLKIIMRNKNKNAIFITIRSKDPKMVMNFKRILIISQ